MHLPAQMIRWRQHDRRQCHHCIVSRRERAHMGRDVVVQKANRDSARRTRLPLICHLVNAGKLGAYRGCLEPRDGSEEHDEYQDRKDDDYCEQRCRQQRYIAPGYPSASFGVSCVALGSGSKAVLVRWVRREHVYRIPPLSGDVPMRSFGCRRVRRSAIISDGVPSGRLRVRHSPPQTGNRSRSTHLAGGAGSCGRAVAVCRPVEISKRRQNVPQVFDTMGGRG